MGLNVLTSVFRRGPVRRLEYCVVVAEICAGSKIEAADQPGTEIADDVAKHILRHRHGVILRVFENPHANGVDVRVVGADIGIIPSEIFTVALVTTTK
jgi:hypothetical protein